MDFDAHLVKALAEWDMAISAGQLRQLRRHFEGVIDANRTMNLTRIVNPAEAAVRHYADSLAVLKWACDRGIEVSTVLDVGTGAGFPAVPLAVLHPDWSITAIDARRKKIDFLRALCMEVNLPNLRCEHVHADHWLAAGTEPRLSADRYSLVVFRALGPLPRALEKTSRFVAPGGNLVAYQSERGAAGMNTKALQVAQAAGLRPEASYPYQLHLPGETLRFSLCIYRRLHED